MSRFDGLEFVAGPVVLLLGLTVSILLQYMFGRMIGDVSCRWRLSYSPDRRAFSIWMLIYVWAFVSVGCQFISLESSALYRAPAITNFAIAFSWMCCGLWAFFFGVADSRNVKDGLVTAAAILVLAAASALVGVVWDRSWRSHDAIRILTVGIPNSIFAGWLCTASALSVGIAVSSRTRAPEEEMCNNRDFDEVYNIFTPLFAASRRGLDAWAPLALACGVCAIAFAINDPILALPVGWGLFFMKGHLRNRVAFELVVVTCIASAVAVYFRPSQP